MSQDAPDKKVREQERPDPEALLSRYHLRDTELDIDEDEERNARPSGDHHTGRGRLRVYLAAVAGSGKTYAMLAEGHRREMRGTDIVIGYVETHNRPQTEEMIGDLEIVPRKKVNYRGVILEEMDTEAIIARHPQVALVDELAHTNVPGSKNAKRYQDVEELQNAGINVITTLNIQHLESLYDVVASITGIRVQETLPDRILDDADEVELVDISPYALRQRMRHGNIYPPDRIETALHNFFREGNLTALRELALRRVAEKTELQLQQYMNEHGISKLWPASERVLVGFDARPHTRQVIRDAWRLAHGLHADLIAVYIQPAGYIGWTSHIVRFFKFGMDTTSHQEEAKRLLDAHIQLAEDLGAQVIRTQSNDIARELVKIAKEHQITQIVLGQPARSWWEEALRGSIVNRLLRLSTEMDIHIVPRGEE